MADEQRIGWGFPGASRKAHFFLDGFKSLCGKWAFTGELEAPLDPGNANDCAECRRRLLKLDLRRTADGIVANAH